MKRRLKFLLKIFLAAFVLLCLFLLFERVRGKISLARYKRELIAQGVKLDPRDFVSRAPESDNGAPQVLEGIRRLKPGAVLPNYYPPAMRTIPSGRAVIGFRESEWVDEKITNHWEEVAAELKTNEQTLAEIRAALEKPVLDNRLDYSLGFRMPFTHLGPAKSLVSWFSAGSQLALHEGRNHEALEFLIADIRLPRLLKEDRLPVSELVRIAMAALARTATWEALQADGWTDADLARVQDAWTNEEFCVSMTRGLEGELMFGRTSFDRFRKSNADTARAFYGLQEWLPDDSDLPHWERAPRNTRDRIAGFLKKQVYCRLWRFAWLDQDERHYLEQMHRLLEISRTAATKKSFAEIRPLVDQFATEAENKNLYDALRYHDPQFPITLSHFVNRAMRADTERSLTICAIALKRYAQRYGKPPASLSALVPEFVPSVPVDYMDGKPMKYHLNPDGSFTLYSVGQNGRDDGGDASQMPGMPGFLWNKKDYIWPSPALPEEVAIWREERVKN